MESPFSVHDYSVVPLILHEDDDIIAVNKPAGMLSQDDSTGRTSLSGIVKDYLKGKFPGDDDPYCSAVHRLDRPVSGVMLFARTPAAAGRLSGDIKRRDVRRFYCAIVNPAPGVLPVPDWTELNQYLVRRRDRAYIVSETGPGAAAVSLKYRTMHSADRELVLVELITGKRHQIRVQLSSLGRPIAGDRFYGSCETVEEGVICLHAQYLRFMHPSFLRPLIISAPLPLHMTCRIGGAVPDISDYLTGC